MKIYPILLVFLIDVNISIAQDSLISFNKFEADNSPKAINKSLYLEGSLFLQSANFETNFYRSKTNTFQMNGRFGVGYFYVDFFGATQSIGGIMGLNFVLGRKNNHFDSSIGGFVGSENGIFAWPIGTIGYRYQKPSGGFLFKTHLGTLGLDIGLGYSF